MKSLISDHVTFGNSIKIIKKAVSLTINSFRIIMFRHDDFNYGFLNDTKMEENTQKAPAKKIALQVLLPVFPPETTMVKHLIGVQKKDRTVYYFNGSMPILIISKAILTAHQHAQTFYQPPASMYER